jgi:branched-chain amino acid transport system ATP-binding protein
MLLSVENLSVSYGGIKAVQGISFEVDEGEIVAIIGANGAGKTTTLRAISRVIPVEPGTKMTFEGQDLLSYPAHKVVSELGITHVPEGRRLFGNLTVMENLRLATYARSDEERIKGDYEMVFGLFPRMAERKGQMARALMSGRKLLLLDEPSMGLAPLLMRDLFRVLREINEEGTTILLVEQNARMALQFAQRGYVLETGSIVLEGLCEELAADPRVKAAYLGG